MENGNQPPASNPPSSEPPKATATTGKEGEGNGSTEKPVDKQTEAYRQQQSRADKAEAASGDMAERLEFLEGMAYEQARDGMIKDFLKEKSKDFPDVSAEDLVRFAASPDDLEETAKYLQDKHDKIKQQTLADAREVPEESMTEDEKQKAKEKLAQSNDPNRFQKFLRIQSMKTRK